MNEHENDSTSTELPWKCDTCSAAVRSHEPAIYRDLFRHENRGRTFRVLNTRVAHEREREKEREKESDARPETLSKRCRKSYRQRSAQFSRSGLNLCG